MTSPIDLILPRLEKVKSRGNRQFMACCPAHGDQSPSLSIRETDDGRVLLKCFGGCSVEDVTGAIGLNLSDLFPDKPSDHRVRRGQARPTLSPWLLLEIIEKDLDLILFATAGVLRGETLSDEDAEVLDQAMKDIRRVIQEGRACR